MSKYSQTNRIHLQFDCAFSSKQNKKTEIFTNRIESEIKKLNNLILRCATSK